MGIMDDMIKSTSAEAKKETPAQRRKRLIEEGKATDSDFDRPDATPAPVLDADWGPYAAAKAEEEKKKKRAAAKTKAARAVTKSDNPEDNDPADKSAPTSGSY